jgi:hypothetical protein
VSSHDRKSLSLGVTVAFLSGSVQTGCFVIKSAMASALSLRGGKSLEPDLRFRVTLEV